MSAQSHKEVVIVKIIRSIDGLTSIEDAIGYADERLLIDIGDDEFVSKRMLTSGSISAFRHVAQVGDAWPVILTNGVEFSTFKTEVDVKQLLIPDGAQATNNGAGTIFRINYTDATKYLIDTIEVDTTTVDGVTVADRCVISVVAL